MSARIARRQARLAVLRQRAPDTRAARFARRIAGAAPVSFNDLARLPDWLLLDEVAQERVARIAGLIANRAAIDSELSGPKLAEFAAVLGEDLFDAACAGPVGLARGGNTGLPHPDEVAEQGWAILHGSLPEAFSGGDAEAYAIATEACRVAQGLAV